MVRFAFSFFAVTLLFLITIISPPTASAATCSISVTPESVPGDYNDYVTIKSDIDCFDINTEYTIIFSPQKSPKKFFPTRKAPDNPRVVIANLNVKDSARGKEFPGEWKVEVCSQKATTNCNDLDNIVAIGFIDVAVLPTPTPVPPLPPCSRWVGWNKTYDETGRKQYVTISPEDVEKYKNSDGTINLRDNDIKCAGINTAIGPIDTEPTAFVRKVFEVVLGLAGGIALVLIMISGYKLMASQGNPEAVQGAREQLTSAIVGLLFIIFSFVILQVVGADILRIPGFQP